MIPQEETNWYQHSHDLFVDHKAIYLKEMEMLTRILAGFGLREANS